MPTDDSTSTPRRDPLGQGAPTPAPVDPPEPDFGLLDIQDLLNDDAELVAAAGDAAEGSVCTLLEVIEERLRERFAQVGRCRGAPDGDPHPAGDAERGPLLDRCNGPATAVEPAAAGRDPDLGALAAILVPELRDRLEVVSKLVDYAELLHQDEPYELPRVLMKATEAALATFRRIEDLVELAEDAGRVAAGEG